MKFRAAPLLFLGLAPLTAQDSTETPLNFPSTVPPTPAPEANSPAATPPGTAAPTDETVPRAVPVPEETRRAVPIAPPPPKRTGPDVDHFNQANRLYGGRDFSGAATMYEDYLRSWPNGEDAPVVWFRMGECFSNLREGKRAEYCYDQLIRRFQKGEMVSSAAYRLGNLSYSVGKYDLAADYFKKARLNAKLSDVIQVSSYYEARSLLLMGLKTQAEENFRRVAENPEGKKEYREAALRELGKIQLEQGDTTAALDTFTKVIQEAHDPEILAESLHYAGVINNMNNQGDTALSYFEKILQLPGVDTWKAKARSSVIQANYIRGDYDAVISLYARAGGILQSETQEPLTLLTVGDAYRKKSMTTRAIEVYRLVERTFPESHEALQAAYNKLLCFFSEASTKLPDFVDAYLKYYRPRFPNDPLLDRAILLKAEYLFSISQTPAEYADAASAYGQIDPVQLPKESQAPLLFKRGWAESLAGAAAMSISTLNRYLLYYPTDSEVPLALVRRGMSRVEQYDYPGAVKDFAQVIKEHPKASCVETALQQSGLVKTQMRDWDGALVDFQTLLKNFPNTKGKVEAIYWIGKCYYEKQDYAKALPPLWQALDEDSENFAEDAGLSIILSHYYAEDAENLAKDIDKITASHPGVPVPPKVLWWLGMKKYQSADYQAAARFLGLGANPKEPDATHPQVWLRLGLARMELGWYKSAAVAARCFLKINNLPETSAEGYMLLADAERELHNFDAAESAVKSGLALAKPGRVRASLEMEAAQCLFARADIAKADGKDAQANDLFSQAAAKFQSISQTFIDKTIQPDAMRLAAESYEQAGKTAQAARLREDLAAGHPLYKPAPPRTIIAEPEILQKQLEELDNPPPVEEPKKDEAENPDVEKKADAEEEKPAVSEEN